MAGCAVGPDEIDGRIVPKPAGQAAAAVREAQKGATPGPSTSQFPSRTVRVEDPRLIEQLQAAGVNYLGERPGLFSQLLWVWILPLGAMALLWIDLSRRLRGGGEPPGNLATVSAGPDTDHEEKLAGGIPMLRDQALR